MSALQKALADYTSTITSIQDSAAFTIDDAKVAALEQAKNAAVQIADTKKIDDTMILHHFAPKIAEYLEKALELGKDINKVAKNPLKAASEDDAENPDSIELQNMADIPPRDPADPTPPPETADPAAIGAPPPQTDDVDEEAAPAVDTDAAASASADADASTLAPGFRVLADVGAVPDTDAEGQQLLDDLDDHFAGSREFELADKIQNGTAEPEDVVNKLIQQRDDIFDQNQPLGTSNKAEELLRRTNDYNARTSTGETTEPPPAPAASAVADDTAAAGDAELEELALI